MKIAFGHEFDSLGNVLVTYTIDTADPAVQTMLTNLKGNALAQTTAGYGVPCNMAAYPGQTRWQAVLGEVVRLNDATARGILGV